MLMNMKFFNAPYNPSFEEIEEWAYTVDAIEPEQEWDIIVDWLRYPDLILRLASDDTCPTQGYFRHLLYVIVGQAVRGTFSTKKKHEIDVLFDHAKKYHHPDIQKWKENAANIFKKPDQFKYDDWFSGKLAKITFS